MTERYRIGEFARLSGTSTKTLRFYDAIGLLRPASTDPRTGYRYYVLRQLSDLASIRALKDVGASLTEVRQLTRSAGDPGKHREMLLALRASAERSLHEAQASLRHIDAALEALDDGASPLPVVIRDRPAVTIASIRSTVRAYGEIEHLEQTLLSSLPADLIGAERGVLWHRCGESGSLEGEPFVSVKTKALPHGAYSIRELPAATLACAYSTSDERSAERAYESIRDWMARDNRRLGGPKREMYRGPLLEIQFPLL